MKRFQQFSKLSFLITLVFLFNFSENGLAQRFAGRGGAARPAASRPATARPAQPRGGAMSRPTQSRPSRPSTANAKKPNLGNNSGSINGGVNRVTKNKNVDSRVNNMKDKPNANLGGNNNLGNRNNNNKVNINNSHNRGDVNININNQHNVNIHNNRNVGFRPYYRPYPRPPFIWGGFGFSWFRPYYYHPFAPFYWGPAWHPWGFFVATLATTAVVIAINDQKYHYDEGVFYVDADDGYVVVEAPQGATVKVIPKDSEQVEVSPTVNNYYYGGTFYEQKDGTYTVVPPPAGAVVANLPEGAEEVKVGDQTFVKYGETYYMPVEVDGKNMYEIVQVDEDK